MWYSVFKYCILLRDISVRQCVSSVTLLTVGKYHIYLFHFAFKCMNLRSVCGMYCRQLEQYAALGPLLGTLLAALESVFPPLPLFAIVMTRARDRVELERVNSLIFTIAIDTRLHEMVMHTKKYSP